MGAPAPAERLRTALADQAPASAPAPFVPPPGALRQVLIHLTTLAPGLADRPQDDDTRWRWLTWVTPAAVVKRTLLRLQRRADQVSLRVFADTPGVEFHDGAEPPEAGCVRLLAIVFDAPAEALIAAHAAMLEPMRKAA